MGEQNEDYDVKDFAINYLRLFCWLVVLYDILTFINML